MKAPDLIPATHAEVIFRLHCSPVDVSERFASVAVAMRTPDDIVTSSISDSSPIVPLRLLPEQNQTSTVDLGAPLDVHWNVRWD
jgi:hypothetical protein